MRNHRTPAIARAHRELGARIARLRRKKGLSQAQLAGRTKLPLHMVEKIEKGEAQLPFTLLTRIADSLDVTLYRLLKGIA